MSFKKDGRGEGMFSDIPRLRECVASRPKLPKDLKEDLQIVGKLYQKETWVYIRNSDHMSTNISFLLFTIQIVFKK